MLWILVFKSLTLGLPSCCTYQTDETPYKQRKLTEGTFSSASSSSNATQTEESTAKSLQAELLEEQRRQLQELQDQLEARERELALREERLNKREQAEV